MASSLLRPGRVSPVVSEKCRVSWKTLPPASSTSPWRTISLRTARSTLRSEFTFFVSVRVPHSVAPRAMREVFTSQRRLPCSMRTSLTPRVRRMSRSSVT